MGFGSSSRSSIKNRKDGTASNSTKSLTIERDGKAGDYTAAYSYAEIICKPFHEKKCLVFNDYNFSPTTSGHYGAIHSFMTEKYPSYKKLYVITGSLNSFDGKNPDTLGNSLRYSDDLEKVFEFFKFSKKKLEAVKKKTEKEDEEARESKNKDARFKRLCKKIETLDYKTDAALDKAITTALEIGRAWNIEVKSTCIESFENALPVLEKHLQKNKDIKILFPIEFFIKNLMASPEKIEAFYIPLFKKYRGYDHKSVGLPYTLETEDRKFINYVPMILRNPQIFEVDGENGNMKRLEPYIKTLETLKTLASLGTDGNETQEQTA